LKCWSEDSQLFAGYRKKGQNVRLAAQLIGWDIDIKSEKKAPANRRADDALTAADNSAHRSCRSRSKRPSKKSRLRASLRSTARGHGRRRAHGKFPVSAKKWWTRATRPLINFYEGGAGAPAAEGSGETGEVADTGDTEVCRDAASDTAEPETAENGNAEAESAVTQPEPIVDDEVPTQLPPEAALSQP